MAERRMFAKTIIDSDAFLEMPVMSQLLYFHLSMRADDEGFINKPKSIMRMLGCKDDDLKLLFIKKFIIPFETGIVVIKHWKIHNYIRKDCFTETKYKDEKAQLLLDENNAYTLDVTESLRICDEDVTSTETQVRIGKEREGQDRVGKDKKSAKAPVVYFPNDEALNKAFTDYVAMRKAIKAPMTDKAIELAIAKLDKLSKGDNDVAIEILNQSIMNSWKGLFELKEAPKRTQESKARVDKWAEALKELTGEDL